MLCVAKTSVTVNGGVPRLQLYDIWHLIDKAVKLAKSANQP